VIGGVPGTLVSKKTEKKLADLSELLGDEDDFATAFATKHQLVKKETKAAQKASSSQQQKEFSLQNRTIFVKGAPHTYVENEAIFYLTEATTARHQSRQCSSCLEEFLKSKDMNYCQFCGYANCKECFKKTRPFYFDKKSAPEKVPRGKICQLCDRKFIIHKLVYKSSTDNDSHKIALTAMQKQNEDMA
jgi:hypothetical protein